MNNALIIEDEVNNREYLRQMRDRFADIAVMGEAGTAEEGIRLIRGVKPDLVFMDIEMPGASGFECLERVRDLNFEIIFVTAYDHYALNAIKFSRSEEHTSELQSLMRNSYAVFCLKKKKINNTSVDAYRTRKSTKK